MSDVENKFKKLLSKFKPVDDHLLNKNGPTSKCNPLTARLIIFYLDHLKPFLINNPDMEKFINEYDPKDDKLKTWINVTFEYIFGCYTFFFNLIFTHYCNKPEKNGGYSNNERAWLKKEYSDAIRTLNRYKHVTPDKIDGVKREIVSKLLIPNVDLDVQESNGQESNGQESKCVKCIEVLGIVNKEEVKQQLSSIKNLFLEFDKVVEKYDLSYYTNYSATLNTLSSNPPTLAPDDANFQPINVTYPAAKYQNVITKENQDALKEYFSGAPPPTLEDLYKRVYTSFKDKVKYYDKFIAYITTTPAPHNPWPSTFDEQFEYSDKGWYNDLDGRVAELEGWASAQAAAPGPSSAPPGPARAQAPAQGQVVKTYQFPKDVAGLIIGQKGATIKKLTSTHNVKIDVNTIGETRPDNKGVLTISGNTPESVDNAYTDIRRLPGIGLGKGDRYIEFVEFTSGGKKTKTKTNTLKASFKKKKNKTLKK